MKIFKEDFWAFSMALQVYGSGTLECLISFLDLNLFFSLCSTSQKHFSTIINNQKEVKRTTSIHGNFIKGKTENSFFKMSASYLSFQF